jgi:hypothetical protein
LVEDARVFRYEITVHYECAGDGWATVSDDDDEGGLKGALFCIQCALQIHRTVPPTDNLRNEQPTRTNVRIAKNHRKFMSF